MTAWEATTGVTGGRKSHVPSSQKGTYLDPREDEAKNRGRSPQGGHLEIPPRGGSDKAQRSRDRPNIPSSRTGDHRKHTVPRESRRKAQLPEHPPNQVRKAEFGGPPGRVGGGEKEESPVHANLGRKQLIVP